MAEIKKPEKNNKNSLPLTKKNNPNNTGKKTEVQRVEKSIAGGAEQKPAKKDSNIITLKPKKAPVTADSLATRKYAWLAYILFFIPLCINSKSAFVRHNANEGLEINIFDAIGLTLTLCGLLINSNSVGGQSALAICAIVGICLLVLTTLTKVYMIAYAAQGKEMSTPWMWNLKIIK